MPFTLRYKNRVVQQSVEQVCTSRSHLLLFCFMGLQLLCLRVSSGAAFVFFVCFVLFFLFFFLFSEYKTVTKTSGCTLVKMNHWLRSHRFAEGFLRQGTVALAENNPKYEKPETHGVFFNRTVQRHWCQEWFLLFTCGGVGQRRAMFSVLILHCVQNTNWGLKLQ